MSTAPLDRCLEIVKQSAAEYPMVFIEMMVRRSFHDTGDDAFLFWSVAVRDMGNWYEAQAKALEAEGERRRGLQVVPDGSEGL